MVVFATPRAPLALLTRPEPHALLQVRGAAFHRSYPLFASSSDDATCHIFHGRVYADLMTNPLIVPGARRTPRCAVHWRVR